MKLAYQAAVSGLALFSVAAFAQEYPLGQPSLKMEWKSKVFIYSLSQWIPKKDNMQCPTFQPIKQISI
ncbi:Uncharacterised protein [Providencia stuartii]|nr:Uncharacterised protein [Providencia stuartii]